MKSRNEIKAGSILSYVQMALNTIIGLLYTPILIRMLGASEYGLYNTVSSTIAMLSILSLGFNTGYIKYYSQYKKDNNNEAITKLNGLYLLIFTIIGIVSLLCGIFLTTNLNLVFDQGLTVAEYETATILMILFTVNLAISFPMSVFQSIISAHEKYIFLKIIGILRTVAAPLLTIPLLIFGYRSIAIIIVTLGVSLVKDVAYIIYAQRKLKVRFCFKNFEKGLFKKLAVFTSFITIILIVDQVNTNIDKFLLARFQGTISVAIYSVGYSLYQYYTMFSNTISGVFAPRIHRIVNETVDNLKERKERLTELFTKVGRIQFIILSLIASGLIFFGKPFIAIWAGKGYEDSYVIALLLVLSSSIELIQTLGIEIQFAQDKHKFRSISYVSMAVVNLILTIVLCQKFGAIGAAIGTAISLVVANGIVMNIYYHKRCNIDIVFFWKNILKASRGLILPVFFGILLNRYFNFMSSITALCLGIVAFVIIYILSMWFFGMNSYEKTLIKDLLNKFIIKKGNGYDG